MEHRVTLALEDTVVLRIPEGMGAISVSIETIPAAPATDFSPINIIDKMPVNPAPTDPKAWWVRTAQDIKGITIHHTGCTSPEQAARIFFGKGRPTTEYAYFVTVEGLVYQCLPDTLAVWHDHTGHYNKNLAIGLAGYWHKQAPSTAQLKGLARIVIYLMDKYDIPLSQVQGHRQRAKEAANIGTECPGWESAGWKQRFFEILEAERAL